MVWWLVAQCGVPGKQIARALGISGARVSQLVRQVQERRRGTALDAMNAALEQTNIEGIANNVGFLRRVVTHPKFVAGDVFTGFIDAYKNDLIG